MLSTLFADDTTSLAKGVLKDLIIFVHEELQ